MSCSLSFEDFWILAMTVDPRFFQSWILFCVKDLWSRVSILWRPSVSRIFLLQRLSNETRGREMEFRCKEWIYSFWFKVRRLALQGNFGSKIKIFSESQRQNLFVDRKTIHGIGFGKDEWKDQIVWRKLYSKELNTFALASLLRRIQSYWDSWIFL